MIASLCFAGFLICYIGYVACHATEGRALIASMATSLFGAALAVVSFGILLIREVLW